LRGIDARRLLEADASVAACMMVALAAIVGWSLAIAPSHLPAR
jgi:hypothetical protein